MSDLLPRPRELVPILSLAGLLCMWSASSAVAQGVTTSAVSGVVTGPEGEPLGGVAIEVAHEPSGSVARTATGPGGRYLVANLRPGGPYRVRAEGLGYAPAIQEGLHLRLGQEQRVDFRLAQQPVELPPLTVTALSPVFSAARTGAETVVDRTTLDHLPTLSRTFTDALVFSPHVIQDGAATSVGGQNNRYNNIQIDGAVNNDVFGLGGAAGLPGGGANARPIPMEAIQEFQILVAPFDVRQTGFTGGLVNAVTRSGTNQLSGSVHGYFRNQAMVGELDGRGVDDFTNYSAGLTVGGPLVEDRAHFFVSAELEQLSEPQVGSHVGEADPGATGITPETAREVQDLARQMGVHPGEFGPFTRENPRRNLFARFDLRLNDRHRATVRHNYVSASLDRRIDRRGGFQYDFTSYMIDQGNTTHSTVVQLFSDLGAWSNEALLTVGFIRDPRDPQFQEPTFHVEFTDPNLADAPGRRIRLGGEYNSHGNELDQDNVQIANNLSRTYGGHRLTFGAHGEYFGFRNLFHPGRMGRYTYSSLEDFRRNSPSLYEVSVLHPEVDDVTRRFGVLQVGAYVQDRWRVTDFLTLTGGLRVDVPFALDEPRENPRFAQEFSEFGWRTGSVPSGNPLWSPRLGFNWEPSTTERRTQLRGGVGVFTGRPPFVWLSNAYGNTGLTTLLVRCEGADAPSFDPADPSPSRCLDGSGAEDGGASVVDLFDEDFRFPQELKVNLAVDRELPLELLGTAELLYSRSVNQIFLEEVNHRGQQGVDPVSGRPVFGTPTASGWDPVRHSEEFLNVIRGTNRSDNDALMVSLELQRRFGERVEARGSYTFSRVRDSQTLGSSVSTSNVGYTPVPGHPSEAPLATSNFERPHRVHLSGTARFLEGLGGTAVTLVYRGQSGRPYAYAIQGDANGDLFPGPATGAGNDLMYVPGGDELAFESPTSRTRLQELMALEPCLEEQRGRIMDRNSCRGPWSDMLDLRVVQSLDVAGRGAELILDVLNLPNLVSEEWGRVEEPAFSEIYVLRLVGRERGTADPDDRLMYSFIGNTDEEGRAALPYVTRTPESQWHAQLGLRLRF